MIRLWNRAQQREEIEQVYGELGLRLIYGNSLGARIADTFLVGHFPSQLYGKYQSSRLSRHKIASFIRQFKIPMEEYEEGPFSSFNDFFIRRFKSGARSFVQAPHELPAFAEGRYLAYEKISEDQLFPVKGKALSPALLLGGEEAARAFLGGPMLIARLCPTDYHRFHFPDSGRALKHWRIEGALHSVNPLALQYKNEIFATNERQVSILETRNFGKLAYIEVGALMVGKIVQTHDPATPFARGDEKGYFLFGASTVIVLGEPDAWKPDADLLDKTSRKLETLVRLGERVSSVS